MTVVNGPSAGSEDALVTPRSAIAAADVPVRADGVELIGEMKGSGYREPPALARRSDGQTIQLTPLLYLVLAAMDGNRTLAEIGAALSGPLGKVVSADNVRSLIEKPAAAGRARG